ncbi:MAG: hypothetical protein BWY68_00268 [bacterium ADurb.Bin400]|nr:MAG: hypothetical protein BWY68_00268 [bacterium ADurb.Bin400]
MNNEKVEGTSTTKDLQQNAARSSQGLFSNTQSQIASIENELEKAQNTLVELQVLKRRLEDEKQLIMAQAAKEQEHETLLRLQEENIRLKNDLSDYHGEIASLKRVISSLKDDLGKSVEQFQMKVVDSLKLLEEADHAMAAKPATEQIQEVSANTKNVQQFSVEKTEEAIKAAERGDTGTGNNQAKALSATDDIIEFKPVASEEEQTPADLVDNDFSDYLKINEELDYLERGIILNDEPAKTEPAQTVNKPVVPEKVRSIEEADKIQKSIKSETKEVAATPEPEKKEEYKKHFWGGKKASQDTSIVGSVPETSKEPVMAEEKRKSFWPFKVNKKAKIVQIPEAVKVKDVDDALGKVKHGKGIGGLVVKASAAVVIVLIGGVAYQVANAEKLREVYINQAEEIYLKPASGGQPVAATGIATEDMSERYREAFTDAPFEETVWNTYDDPDFGIKLDYPHNTSNKHRPMDSNSIWFLRKYGYLLKIEKVEVGEKTLDDYISEFKSEIGYKVENPSQFKHLPAIHLVQNEYMSVRGNMYLVKIDSSIFKIWYKTFVPAEDENDAKRVEQMLKSIEFTKSPSPQTS